ncbi:MAG: hypothetical protein MRY78_02935 [Saprospiraceae bacterium]|nr:hypothetical protein [Saprospiraceae bacterium]
MRILLFLLLSLAFGACKTTQNTTAECTETGTVKNLQGLDGCDLIINTGDGRAFIPTDASLEKFALEDSQQIRFGYKLRDDLMGICMAGQIVELTCVEQLGDNLPIKKECFDVSQPQQAPWLKEAIVKHETAEIYKYPYRTDGWAYLLKGKIVYLYDCQGTLLCKQSPDKAEECLKKVMPGEKGTLIWRKEYQKQ